MARGCLAHSTRPRMRSRPAAEMFTRLLHSVMRMLGWQGLWRGRRASGGSTQLRTDVSTKRFVRRNSGKNCRRHFANVTSRSSQRGLVHTMDEDTRRLERGLDIKTSNGGRVLSYCPQPPVARPEELKPDSYLEDTVTPPAVTLTFRDSGTVGRTEEPDRTTCRRSDGHEPSGQHPSYNDARRRIGHRGTSVAYVARRLFRHCVNARR